MYPQSMHYEFVFFPKDSFFFQKISILTGCHVTYPDMIGHGLGSNWLDSESSIHKVLYHQTDVSQLL